MDRAHLELKYEDTEIKSVVLYVRTAGGDIVVGDGIKIEQCEQRPIDEEDEAMFAKISHSVERCIWSLFTPMFRRVDGGFLSPSSVRITQGSLVKEPCGKEWMLVHPSRQFAGTMWRCPSVEWLGDAMVPR